MSKLFGAVEIGGIYDLQLLALFGAFALLVRNAAAGLASRLAGSLALAAAAVLSAFAQVTGFDGKNTFHNRTSIRNMLHSIMPLK